ncbi:MAG: hypothetical protein LBQ77_04380 [Treponema sp.]|jgi:hypothetical protein|nr:hypothetical protein [Treponema sp.]
MSNKDYIPRGDGQFLEWARILIAYVLAHLIEFKIDQAALTAIQTLFAAYESAYEAAENPNRGKVDVLNKNETRDALKTALRAFNKGFLLYNPAVTDADKKSMDLPLHDKKPTPHPAPDTHPIISTESKNPFELILHIHDSESEKRGKPDFASGAVLFYVVSDTPISNPEDLQKTELITRMSHTLNFSPTDRGKTVYMAGRWQNAKGDKGPWSEVYSAIIP